MTNSPRNQPCRIRAVVVAAGSGTRFGGDLPKQFELLAGKPVFVHSIEALASLGIERIALVTPPEGLPESAKPHLRGLESKLALVPGGARRQDSVAAGLTSLGDGFDVALVHDAARPLLPIDATRRLVERTMDIGGGLLALPAVDTIKQSDAAGLVKATLDRRTIWLAQTPQAIRADHLPRLIELLQGPEEFTDEAAAMERLAIPIALVEGSGSNFKITWPEDLRAAEQALAAARTS